MKILVTGGYGFIGRHLVNTLTRIGHDVSTLDIAPTLLYTNDHIDQTKHYIGDITDQKYIDDVFLHCKPEAVYHLASKVSVRQSVLDPISDFNTNVMGSLNIILACQKYKVKRLLFSSSGGTVYGDYGRPARETDALDPVSPYGISKQAVENLIRFYFSENTDSVTSYTILRYANVYGPYQNINGDCGVISIFADKMSKNEPVTIFGNGEQVRDYIYVQDVVDTSVRALENAKNEIYNIGTGKETTILELFNILAKKLNYNQQPVFDSAKSGELFYNCLNVTKGIIQLSMRNLFNLEAGLEFTLKTNLSLI